MCSFLTNRSKPVIRFHMLNPVSYLDRRGKLKTFLTEVIESAGYDLESLDYIFCDDAYLLQINRKYLKHDTYTDIITFNLADKKNKIKGEIYISLERVEENAGIYLVSRKNELHRVIFHGVLHLIGYTDKTAAAKKKMTSAENKLLADYFR